MLCFGYYARPQVRAAVLRRLREEIRMNDSSSFNGSDQLLADALQQVVREAVWEGVAPVREDMQTRTGPTQ